jgi:hypothetical protein
MIASRIKARIIDMILVILSCGFFAIFLAALLERQPKNFLFIPNASILLFLKRFFP